MPQGDRWRATNRFASVLGHEVEGPDDQPHPLFKVEEGQEVQASLRWQLVGG
jgi:hypothetical protein